MDLFQQPSREAVGNIHSQDASTLRSSLANAGRVIWTRYLTKPHLTIKQLYKPVLNSCRSCKDALGSFDPQQRKCSKQSFQDSLVISAKYCFVHTEFPLTGPVHQDMVCLGSGEALQILDKWNKFTTSAKEV